MCPAANEISFFEEGFNDRLITREGQVKKVKDYIADNPRRWMVKHETPEYFQKLYHIFINGKEWNVIGNIFLLKDFDIQAVKVSSRYSAKELLRKKRLWWFTVINDGVLASPFIREDEKKVRNWTWENEGRIIQLMDKPFRERYKPYGKNFDRCAEGRLLQVAPAFEAPEHMIKPWADELNDAAQAIAEGRYELRRAQSLGFRHDTKPQGRAQSLGFRHDTKPL